MGYLSESDRERVLAKARADAERQGLPAGIEDGSFRRKVGALLIDVKDRLSKSPRREAGSDGSDTLRSKRAEDPKGLGDLDA